VPDLYSDGGKSAPATARSGFADEDIDDSEKPTDANQLEARRRLYNSLTIKRIAWPRSRYLHGAQSAKKR